MIKLAQSLIKPQVIRSQFSEINILKQGVQECRRQNSNFLSAKQQYGFKNFIYKWKVRYNLVHLIEDERKVYFFMKIVDKYYKNDIEKVDIGSQEILSRMKDPKYTSKVRQLLITALQQNNDKYNFFKLLEVRISLINDLILISDQKGAQKHLEVIKENYKELVRRNIDQEDLEKLMHQYIISNLQIQNFSEALIFADKIKLNLDVFKQQINNDKSKQEQYIHSAIPLYSYFWAIYRQGQNNYSKAMEAYNDLKKTINKQDKKLVKFVNPQALSQFDDMMVDVIQFNIENKEFEKCKDIFEFYSTNAFQNPEKQKGFQNVLAILQEIKDYYDYLDLASQRFQRLTKIDQNDQDIYAYSVEEYYKYASYLNKDIGVDLSAFLIHKNIQKISMKFSGTCQKRIQASIYRFDNAIKERDLQDEIEEEEERKKEEEKNKMKGEDSQQDQEPIPQKQQEEKQRQTQSSFNLQEWKHKLKL